MILLDTHVLVRYMQDEAKLGRRARSTIDRAVVNAELFISVISFWEVATLVAKRRLELDTTVAAFRDLAIRNGAHEQVLDGDITTRAGELPDAHGEPADRMLVAMVIVRGLTLVTADAMLLGWKLRGFRGATVGCGASIDDASAGTGSVRTSSIHTRSGAALAQGDVLSLRNHPWWRSNRSLRRPSHAAAVPSCDVPG